MDVSDIFHFFSVRGPGKRGVPNRQEGGWFLFKIPGRGSPKRWGAGGAGARGQEGVCVECSRGRGGGQIFCSGPKFPPRLSPVHLSCRYHNNAWIRDY